MRKRRIERKKNYMGKISQIKISNFDGEQMLLVVHITILIYM